MMPMITLPWILWILHLAAFAFGQPPSTTNPTNAHNETALVCLPFGICEPCPDDSLHEPFCQPFGNRRLVHCLPAPSGTPTPTGPHVHAPSATVLGEIPAWESCGRIVERERADFYEFLACNAFLALLAVAVLFARSRRLQAAQARHLAARIGLVRPVPPGWSSG